MHSTTVDFDIYDIDGEKVGNISSWGLPRQGDYLRVYGIEETGQPTWEVVRCEFLPDDVNVIVKRLVGEGATTSSIAPNGTFR
jgi:hypothetical protein